MGFNPYKKLTDEEKYVIEMEHKYYKMKMEYNEVSRNKLVEKYENLERLMHSIYLLIEDGYKYRKQMEEDIKRWCN